ncbi:MAG TPA: LuxR C-terminal-related transcriptional regulator [Pseudonocardiaceae bacterium]|nr:LuxR C-terminal-related transcriptional regulator [Pseudonocardiaceae bacterium]
MADGYVVDQVIGDLMPERLDRMRQLTGLPCVLGGATRHDRQLTLDRLVGTTGDALRGLVIRPGRGLGGSVLSRRAPLRVHDYATALGITHDYDPVVRAEGLTSVFAVPVLIKGEVRGVLYGAVHDRRRIPDSMVRTTMVLAEQLQQDVENRMRRRPGSHTALAELAALIRDTTDSTLRSRLVRIQQDLTGQPPDANPKSNLSPREIDTLRLVEVGASNVEIAARLGLRMETVKAYLRSAMRKLQVHNRTAAAHQARLNGML